MRYGLRELVKSYTPATMLESYRLIRRHVIDARNRFRSPEQVFSEVYRRNEWGGERGKMFSGSGSNDEIVDIYIETLRQLSPILGFANMTFVDLGCGDYRVGRRVQELCRRYIGVDVVKSVVSQNTKLYGNDKVEFIHADITKDELPSGDVCFIRQVFQHLSNEQILRIIEQLNVYKYVFITEHYPLNEDRVAPNIDKIHGGAIRVRDGSGVYLAEPPFNVPSRKLEMITEVAAPPIGGVSRPGIIATMLYRPV